jgi:hypothetical protein
MMVEVLGIQKEDDRGPIIIQSSLASQYSILPVFVPLSISILGYKITCLAFLKTQIVIPRLVLEPGFYSLRYLKKSSYPRAEIQELRLLRSLLNVTIHL